MAPTTYNGTSTKDDYWKTSYTCDDITECVGTKPPRHHHEISMGSEMLSCNLVLCISFRYDGLGKETWNVKTKEGVTGRRGFLA